MGIQRVAAQTRSVTGGALRWFLIGPFVFASELGCLAGDPREPLPVGDQADSFVINELLAQLSPFWHRARFYRTLLLFLRAVVLAGLVLLLGVALQTLGIWRLPSWFGLVLAAVFAWALFLSWNQRLSRSDVARVIDRQLGLRALLGTAVELTLQRRAEGGLGRLQVHQATVVVRDLSPVRAIPFPNPYRDLRALAVVALLVALVSYLGTLQLTLPRRSDAIDLALVQQKALEAQAVSSSTTLDASQLPAISQQAAANRDSTTATLDTLQRQLAAKEITSSQYRQRLMALSQALQSQAQESANTQTALTTLAKTLGDTSSTTSITSSLNRGDYASASSQLNDLSKQVDQLSPQARAELANRLAQAARNMTDSNQNLAQTADQAAQALRQGNNSKAAQSLQSLGKAVQQASQQVASQSQLGQELSSVQSSLGQSPSAASQAGSHSSGQDVPSTGLGQSAPTLGSGLASDNPNTSSSSQGDPGGGVPGGAIGQNARIQTSSTSVGADAGNGRGGPALGQNSLALRVGGTKLQITGQASNDGSSLPINSNQPVPLTASNGGQGVGSGSSTLSDSTKPINAHAELNSVPLGLKPVVQQYFSSK